jgi:hypothetical protein
MLAWSQRGCSNSIITWRLLRQTAWSPLWGRLSTAPLSPTSCPFLHWRRMPRSQSHLVVVLPRTDCTMQRGYLLPTGRRVAVYPSPSQSVIKHLPDVVCFWERLVISFWSLKTSSWGEAWATIPLGRRWREQWPGGRGLMERWGSTTDPRSLAWGGRLTSTAALSTPYTGLEANTVLHFLHLYTCHLLTRSACRF